MTTSKWVLLHQQHVFQMHLLMVCVVMRYTIIHTRFTFIVQLYTDRGIVKQHDEDEDLTLTCSSIILTPHSHTSLSPLTPSPHIPHSHLTSLTHPSPHIPHSHPSLHTPHSHPSPHIPHSCPSLPHLTLLTLPPSPQHWHICCAARCHLLQDPL